MVVEAGRIGIAGVLVKNSGTLNASSVVKDGGRIFLKATQNLQLAGSSQIEARSASANGGFVETSGANVKIADGARVDTSAPNGTTGTWLIDPNDFTIGSDMSGAAVASALDSTDLTIQTATMGTAGGNGDIFVNESVTKTGATDTTLTLAAERNIAINAPISSSSSKLSVTLQAHALDNAAPGNVTIQAGINTNGGNLIVGGGLDPALTPAIGSYDGLNYLDGVLVQGAQISANGGNITINGQGSIDSVTPGGRGVHITGGATVQTTSGTLHITGQGGTDYSGISIENSLVESAGAGNITITGTGGSGTSYNNGILLDGATLRAVDGSISLTGQGGNGSSDGNIGIAITNQSTIEATGSGGITLLGYGGTGYGYNSGIDAWNGPNLIRTNSGAINITGFGGTAATGYSNIGVWLEGYGGGTTLESMKGGNVTITGTGGGGTYGSNHGVDIAGASQVRTYDAGNISITGTGGIADRGNNVGVKVEGIYDWDANGNYGLLRPVVEAMGTGSLTIQGTGGISSGYYGYNHGVEIVAASIRARDGLLSISGTGGQGSYGHNAGILLSGYSCGECGPSDTNYSVVESIGTGAIQITGTGGSSGYAGNENGNNGVVIEQYSVVRSAGGAVTIEGTAAGTGDNPAILIDGSVMANSAHGAGLVSIAGTTAGGSYGISIGSYGAIVAGNREVTLDSSASGGSYIAGGNYAAGSVQAEKLTVSGPLTLYSNGYDPMIKVRGQATFDDITGAYGTNVNVVAGSITAGNISTAISSGNYSSGAISLAANAGSISAGDLTTSLTNPNSSGYTSGQITLKALDNVTTGVIDTSIVSDAASTGDAGAVSVIVQRGAIATGSVNTSSKTTAAASSGHGGNVFMSAGSGIGTGSLDTSSEAAGDAGSSSWTSSDGGNITLYASGGDVHTNGAIDAGSRLLSGNSDSLAGNAGAVILRASDNVLVEGAINAVANNLGTGSSGSGGEVSLYALDGTLTVTNTIDASSTNGNGGNVTLYSIGDTRVFGTTLTAASDPTGLITSAGGIAGQITIIGNGDEYSVGYAPNGDYILKTISGDISGVPYLSEARNVILSASGSIDITNQISGYAAGGWVSMRAADGNITVGAPVSSLGGDILLHAMGSGTAGQILGSGYLTANGYGASFVHGGNIRLVADGSIDYSGNISANGSGGSGNPADGGTILIQSRYGSIGLTGNSIQANGNGNGGNGGSIEITLGNAFDGTGTNILNTTGSSGSITLGTVGYVVGISANGSGGYGYGGDGGKGGNVRISTALASTGGGITHYGSINAGGGQGSYAPDWSEIAGGKGGDGGSVIVEAGTGSAIMLGSIYASGGNGGYGSYNDGSYIGYSSRGGDGGRGGSISVTAPGAVTVDNINANGGYFGLGKPGGNGGDGGIIELASTAGDVSVNGSIGAYGASGNCCSGWGGDGGKGGTVTLGAGGSVSILNSIDVGGGDGGDGGYVYNYYNYGEPTRGGDGGAGGTITITAQTNFNANTLYANGGSGGDGLYDGGYGVYTTLGGDGGKGGTVTLDAGGTLTLSGIDAYGRDGAAGRPAGNGGGGGSVTLASGGDLTAGWIDAYGGYGGFVQGGNGGKGGTVDISSTAGNIVIGNYIDAEGGYGGYGGDNGSDSTAPFYAGGRGGDGGSVTIAAQNGVTLSGWISAAGGDGGDGFWNSRYGWGYASPGGDGGKGGTVSISANGALELNGGIYASGAGNGAGSPSGNGGDGGSITLIGGSGVTVGYAGGEVWNYTHIEANGGHADSNSNGIGGHGGKGGAIALVARDGDINVTGYLTARGGDSGYGIAPTTYGGDGGTVEISLGGWSGDPTSFGSASHSITINGNIDATGGSGYGTYADSTAPAAFGGKGGDVGITTEYASLGGSIAVNGDINAYGGSGGQPGYGEGSYSGPGGGGGLGGNVTLRSTGIAADIAMSGNIDVTGGGGGYGYRAPNGLGGNGGSATVQSAGNIALGSIYGNGGYNGGSGGTVLIESTSGNISVDYIEADASGGSYWSAPPDVVVGNGLEGGHGGNVTLRVTAPGAQSYISVNSISAMGAYGGYTADSTASGGAGGDGGTVRFEFGTLAAPGSYGGAVSLSYSYLSGGSGGYGGSGWGLSGLPGSVTAIAYGGDLTVGRSSDPADSITRANTFVGVDTNETLYLQAPNGKVLSGISSADAVNCLYWNQCTDAEARVIDVTASSGIGSAAAPLTIYDLTYDSLLFSNIGTGDVHISSDSTFQVDSGSTANGSIYLTSSNGIILDGTMGNVQATGGSITYTADWFEVYNPDGLNGRSIADSSIRLQPYYSGSVMSLDSGATMFTDYSGSVTGWLPKFDAPNLIIGDTINTASISLGGITPFTFRDYASGGIDKLTLETAGGVSQNIALVLPGALAVNAGSDVTLTDPGNQISGRIDMATTGAINLNNSSPLTTLGNISGAWLDAYGTGDVSVLGTVTGPASIHIEAGANGRWLTSGLGGNLTLAPGSALDAGSSFIELVADKGSGTSNGDITATGATISAGGGVYLQSDGNVGLGQITATGALVEISAGGTISGTGPNITAGDATLTSLNGSTAGTFAISASLNVTGTLTASVNGTAGDIQLDIGGNVPTTLALTPAASGRWLVYTSIDPNSAPSNLTQAALGYDFKQYAATFGGPVSGAGNGLLYSYVPASLVVTLTNTGVTKYYDSTVNAPAGFTPTFNVTGLIGGDSATAVDYTTATYDNAHVAFAGNHLTLSGLSLPLGSVKDGSAVVYGYPALIANSPSVSASIMPVPLTITANNAVKTYGQAASFTGVEFTTGVLQLQGSDTVSSVTLTSAGDAATAHVGSSPYAIVASAPTGSNFDVNDYTVTYVNGNLTVNTAPLTITANNAVKTYGQTATFAGTAFTSSGLQNSETIGSVTETSTGAVATAHVVGSPYAIVASAPTGGSFTAGDYAISYANGNLTVNAAPLFSTATIGGTTAKMYDGTTAATGATVSGSVTGAVNGDTLTLNTSGVTLAYNSAHVVGASSIGATGSAGLTISSSAGSLASDYSFTAPTISPVAGSISAVPLSATAAIGGTTTKVYDGTMAATGATLSGSVTGAVAGDVLTLNTSGVTLNYNSAHVIGATSIGATGSVGLTINSPSFGSLASDYSFTAPTISPVVGSISAAPLTATATIGGTTTKVYDGTTAVTGATVGGTVNGAISGDVLALTTSGVTLAYNSAHVVNATSISATGSIGLAISSSGAGSQMTDYSFTAPTLSSVAGNITAKTLTASLTNTGVTKPYDGTTTASFTPTYSVSGLLSGDTAASFTTTSQDYNSAHVASASYVTVGGLSVSGITGGLGSLASDYSLGTVTSLSSAAGSASITPAVLTVNGNWSTPASWIGGLLPQNTDLLGVLIPISTNVTFDGVGGPTSIPYLTSTGKLTMTGGTLTVAGAFSTVDYAQTGGALTAASIDINSAGAISQTGGSLVTPTLTTLSVGGTTLNGANAIGSISAGNSGSGDITLTNTGALSIAGIGNSAGNIVVSNAGPVALDNGSQVYTSTGTVTLDVLNASSLTLDNGSVINGNQGVFIGASGVSLNHASTIQTGPVATANVEMVISEGDITLDNGSSVLAGNDAIFTLTGANAQVVLNSAPGEAPSTIKTEYTALTTHINFLSRTADGIVIDGTPGITTTDGGSGFYALGKPATLSNGLDIVYPGSGSSSSDNGIVANVIDQYFAEVTQTASSSEATEVTEMTGTTSEDDKKKKDDDTGNNEGKDNNGHQQNNTGQCT